MSQIRQRTTAEYSFALSQQTQNSKFLQTTTTEQESNLITYSPDGGINLNSMPEQGVFFTGLQKGETKQFFGYDEQQEKATQEVGLQAMRPITKIRYIPDGRYTTTTQAKNLGTKAQFVQLFEMKNLESDQNIRQWHQEHAGGIYPTNTLANRGVFMDRFSYDLNANPDRTPVQLDKLNLLTDADIANTPAVKKRKVSSKGETSTDEWPLDQQSQKDIYSFSDLKEGTTTQTNFTESIATEIMHQAHMANSNIDRVSIINSERINLQSEPITTMIPSNARVDDLQLETARLIDQVWPQDLQGQTFDDITVNYPGDSIIDVIIDQLGLRDGDNQSLVQKVNWIVSQLWAGYKVDRGHAGAEGTNFNGRKVKVVAGLAKEGIIPTYLSTGGYVVPYDVNAGTMAIDNILKGSYQYEGKQSWRDNENMEGSLQRIENFYLR